jgi:hypothetical protein
MTTEEAPSQDTFSITFPQESGHTANSAAASLSEAIRDIDPSLSVTRQKSNPNSQDPGSLLTIVLGKPRHRGRFSLKVQGGSMSFERTEL